MAASVASVMAGEPAGGSHEFSLEALIVAMHRADATPDMVRSAVTRYVRALREASVPPERVLASIKHVLGPQDPGRSVAPDDWRAMAVRWFIDEYYRPDRQARFGVERGAAR